MTIHETPRAATFPYESRRATDYNKQAHRM